MNTGQACSVSPRSGTLRACIRPTIITLAAMTLGVCAAPRAADAACNVLPIAKRQPPYRSTLGSIDDPIASPDVAGVPDDAKEVVLRIDPNCDVPPTGGTLGFIESPIGANEIQLKFGPPSVSIDATPTDVTDCDGLDPGRCRTLKFVMPDTTLSRPGAPEGAAGVATILVQDTAGNELAKIDKLYEYRCEKVEDAPESQDQVFGSFVVLPRPNVLQPDLTSQILASEDGRGALLVPLSFTNVRQPDTQGERATWLHGWSDFAAKDGANDSLRSVIAAFQSRSDFVRAFTLNGRPLPPLVRLTAQGEMIGFTDSDTSVVRIACKDPNGPSSASSLCRFTDRRAANGPVKLGKDVQLGKDVGLADRPAFLFPLASIRSSEQTVALVREETADTQDWNFDGDKDDLVPHVTAVDRGEIRNTRKAAAATALEALELEVAGGAAAFPEMTDRVFQLFDSNGVRKTVIGSWPVAERRVIGGRDTFALSTTIAAFARAGEPRDPLSVFRWDNPTLLDNLEEAKLAALSHDRLVYVAPETQGSTTLTTRLRDYATAVPDCVHDLKVSANRLVISSDLIVLTVGDPGNDAAGEVRVFAVSKDTSACDPPAEVELAAPLDADSIGAWGALAAFGVVDSASPGMRRLHALEVELPIPPSVTPVDLKHAVEDFVVGEDAVAFRANESQDGKDHNGDGDQNESVMFFYRPTCPPCTANLTACCDAGICKTGLAARPCTHAKCDARTPYRIMRGSLWFIANEDDQGATGQPVDLDGTPLGSDVMASVPLKSCGFAEYDPGDPPPIVALPIPPGGGMPPIDFAGGLVQLAALPASSEASDGGATGASVAVEGDQDDDGVFDFIDKCDFFRDAKQIDRDDDGIGDACDTDVTLCEDVPRESCQNAVASGHGSALHVRPDGKGFVWTWHAADGVGADLPDPIATLASYSLCVYGKTAGDEPRLLRTNFFAGERCGRRPCWIPSGADGWRYEARQRSSFDVVAMAYHDPTFPQAELVVRTEGTDMLLAPLGAHVEPQALVGTVTLQLVADDGSGPVCLGAKSVRIR